MSSRKNSGIVDFLHFFLKHLARQQFIKTKYYESPAMYITYHKITLTFDIRPAGMGLQLPQGYLGDCDNC